MSDITARLSTALADRYQIERHLGEGGMATVYLAEDLKHKRKVAVKVLRPELAAVLGAERFVQEITTTANLQHPHILPLFDSGEADGFLYYVMPFIDGETLREKLDRETQLGIDESVSVATAIADALDYAHRHNVIHRDIKPENILLHDGRPMVADFGIALAVSAAAGGRMTETGLSLGTPHYMSPEQATADKDITARSDVYSLGSVLYEMLAGEPPHMGNSAQQIIMKIIAEDAQPVTARRKNVPPNISAAVATALEKLPADRFDSARAFAEALANPSFTTRSAGPSAPRPVAAADPSVRRSAVTLTLAAVTVLALALAAWSWLRPSPPPVVTRLDVTPRAGRVLDPSGTAVALSPDGMRIVYVGEAADSGTQLWVRSLEELDPTPVPGTEGATSAAVSPDGDRLAFTRAGTILTVPLAGGPTLTIADGEDPAWADDGTLYFARDQIIYRVRVGGQEPEAWTTEVDGVQVMPAPLPDGMGLLLTVRRSYATQSRIAVVGPDGGVPREVLDGTMARYAASGHIVYTTADGTLLAAPFDLQSLEPGPPVSLIANVEVRGSSHTLFALSGNGTLLYQTGAASPDRELVWVNRNGEADPIDPDWVGGFGRPALSPDGRALAVTHDGEVWVKRLDGTPPIRLTFDDERIGHPTWTPEGDSITGAGDSSLVTRRADGSGQAVQTLSDPRGAVAPAWSRDGTWLVYRTNLNMAGHGDILAIRPGVDSAPREVVATRAYELSPALSPDGRWLAYASDETGRMEVYVVPFPNSDDGKWSVSTTGGETPRWSPTGRELFYTAGDAMVAVEVTTSPTFSVVASRELFVDERYSMGGLHPPYDIAPDGRRFLMIRTVETDDAEEEPRLVLVQNFLEELKTKVGN